MKNKEKKNSGIIYDFKMLIHFLGLTKGISKAYIPAIMFAAIAKSVSPIVNTLAIPFIINEIKGERRIEAFIFIVGSVILINFLFGTIVSLLDSKIAVLQRKIIDGFDEKVAAKIMGMDFQNIEDPDMLDLKERAIYPIRRQGVMWRITDLSINIVSQVITLISMAAIILTLDIYIVLVALVIVALNSFIFKKMQKNQFVFQKELITINRSYNYYVTLTSDFKLAKDVRLYDMEPLIMGKMKKYTDESVSLFGNIIGNAAKYEGLSSVNVQFQMFFIYGYIVYKVFNGAIGIAGFAMYANAANQFSTNLSGIIKGYIEIRQICRYLEPYLELDAVDGARDSGEKSTASSHGYEIEFKNVSFKYPKSDEYTLKNISLKIKSGEKLSVVGSNGAGKTTFIKLLTRLYKPDEGEILLNGVDIADYDYDEYMDMLGVVFQDFKLFSFSVKENIALDDKKGIDDDLIQDSLDKSGLKKDIMKLTKGVDTIVYKNFDKDGIEFSGGQSQKMAISRTMYKDAPVVVLDEPTAALDPIAEFEIYSKFNELIGDKTAIYISHRMSSCQFCDRVAVFHQGEIVQHGTHEELLKDENNMYNKMYMAQAQYYV